MRTTVDASKMSAQQKRERTSDVDGRRSNRIGETFLNSVSRVIQEKVSR